MVTGSYRLYQLLAWHRNIRRCGRIYGVEKKILQHSRLRNCFGMRSHIYYGMGRDHNIADNTLALASS